MTKNKNGAYLSAQLPSIATSPEVDAVSPVGAW